MEKPKKIIFNVCETSRAFYGAKAMDLWLDSAGEGLPEYRNILMGSPYSHEQAEAFNECLDLCTLAIAKHYIRRNSVSVERIYAALCQEFDPTYIKDRLMKSATTIHKLIGGER